VFVSLLKNGLVVRLAAGYSEDDDERQRYQRGPYPCYLCHRDYYADDRVVHFHNLVSFLLVEPSHMALTRTYDSGSRENLAWQVTAQK